MNYSTIVVADLETGGLSTERSQIVQIGAIAIDARRLEIIEGSEFNILTKPFYGEEAKAKGLEEITEGAIAVHKKGHALLAEKGVDIETGLKIFVTYVHSHNYSKTKWKAPIVSGYNIINYDLPILNREFNRFGIDDPFHPTIKLDVMMLMWNFFENDKNVTRLSADSLIRKHMGWKDKGESHDALGDVIMTAEVLIKSMRLIRKAVGTVKFENCFAL
jgi:DNA polymerase III epsilon subunit-like protein